MAKRASLGDHVIRVGISLLLFSTVMGCEMLEPKPDGPPTYAFVSLRHDASRIRMVTLMETYGAGSCELAIEQFLESFHEGEDQDDAEQWRETERSCKQTLEELYQRVLNKEQFHATYLVLSARDDLVHDMRIVLFGIPATEAQDVCELIARDMAKRLTVKAQCIQGTVG